MLANVIGMESDKVKINVKKMESYIERDSKIEFFLKEIEEQAKKAYKSENGNRFGKDNSLVIEAQHIKTRNLRSYKNYTEKYIYKYSKVTTEAIDLSKDIIKDGDVL